MNGFAAGFEGLGSMGFETMTLRGSLQVTRSDFERGGDYLGVWKELEREHISREYLCRQVGRS